MMLKCCVGSAGVMLRWCFGGAWVLLGAALSVLRWCSGAAWVLLVQCGCCLSAVRCCVGVCLMS
eukprot:5350596-Lingulodinium_polyedra.AAC.1